MGFFGDKSKSLITPRWLHANRVSRRYSDVFKKSRRWVKKECKRVEQVIAELKGDLAEQETELRRLMIEKVRRDKEYDYAMKNRADAKISLEILLLNKQAAAEEVVWKEAEIADKSGRIHDRDITLLMLNWIIFGVVATAEQLQERPRNTAPPDEEFLCGIGTNPPVGPLVPFSEMEEESDNIDPAI